MYILFIAVFSEFHFSPCAYLPVNGPRWAPQGCSKQAKRCNDALQTLETDFFYELLKNTKDKNNSNNDKMKNKLIDAKKELIMYGTDDVIYALNDYLTSLTTDGIGSQLDKFLNVMLLIRKDMCGETKISRDDIMLNIIQDKEELQKLKNLTC